MPEGRMADVIQYPVGLSQTLTAIRPQDMGALWMGVGGGAV